VHATRTLSPDSIRPILPHSATSCLVADQKVVSDTVPLPEALLVSRLGDAGVAAMVAFLRIQDSRSPAMAGLMGAVPGAPSVTISMNRGSTGGLSVSGPKAEVSDTT
jgi:hypothetical protein